MQAEPVTARWIEAGVVAPLDLHATYAGLAYSMNDHSAPVVVWARATPHVCLGQSQGLCEVADDVAVPVVRRPLGGGAVWVDEDQYCYALVAPRTLWPQRHDDWFRWALEPARRTLYHFGLAAEFRGSDLWVGARKIAGSGAATLGRAGVVASSFLLRFPAARFARAMAAPSDAYRQWLVDALARGMTDWESEAAPPTPQVLRAVFRGQLAAARGWTVRDHAPSAAEKGEIAEARKDLAEPIEFGRRTTPDGIKINHLTYLTERRAGQAVERRVDIDGRAARCEIVNPCP